MRRMCWHRSVCSVALNWWLKLGLLLNQYGLVVAWACATTHVAANTFPWLVWQCEERMIVLSDTTFHATEGDPTNLKLCQRGARDDRMLVETVLSMRTLVRHCKKAMHRVWAEWRFLKPPVHFLNVF